jgi:hypothetical protein
LDYILFEHDLVNEIASAGVLTNTCVKEVSHAFVDANAKNLDPSQVSLIVDRVLNMLGVPSAVDQDYADFGLSICESTKSLEGKPEDL